MARKIRIFGGGPAGCAAALAAIREGADVELFDRARYPRHKVCGEVISAEAAPVLESLGVLEAFLAARPARLDKIAIHIGSREKSARLPDAALGLSRYALDSLLFQKNPGQYTQTPFSPDIIATGRQRIAFTGDRLFGFKAHFSGAATDSIELFFFARAYVGVSAVEGGVTNVCGLAPESLLRAQGFDFDALVNSFEPLRARIRPLARCWKWIATGPIAFGWQPAKNGPYRAGDALGFIDPFTGSGILNALYTGREAGIAAVRGTPVAEYVAQCRSALARPFAVAALLRRVVALDWNTLAAAAPLALLYRLTRLVDP